MSDSSITCIQQTWGVIEQALTEAGLAGPPTNDLADSFPEQVSKAIVARLSNHEPSILPAYAHELRAAGEAEGLRERARNAEQAAEELRDLLRAIVIPGQFNRCPVCDSVAVLGRNEHFDGCAWAEARRVLERDGVELDG